MEMERKQKHFILVLIIEPLGFTPLGSPRYDHFSSFHYNL